MSLRSRLGFTQEPLYLMDGSAFVFRGFYAFQNMSRSDGFPTNAVYIVARILLKLLREEKPAYFAFVLDGKGKNFRHELFPPYKAQRSATPEPLVRQMEPLRRLLDALGIPTLVSEGCEADDCIASLAFRFRGERPVVMVGADKDLKQCLSPDVLLWDPAAKDEKIVTLADFQAETGFAPESWPDYQALVGDSSDNIPGVPQVGPKTAVGLIQAFPHLEDLFDRLPAVPPKVRGKLEGRREDALLYRELTTLRTNACPETALRDLRLRPACLQPLLEFMAEYELRSLAREVESMARAGFFPESGPTAEGPPAPIRPVDDSAGTGLATAPSSRAEQGTDLAGETPKTSEAAPPAVPAARKKAPAVQAGLFDAVPATNRSLFIEVGRASELPCFSKGAKEGMQVVALLPRETDATVTLSGSGELGEPGGMLMAGRRFTRSGDPQAAHDAGSSTIFSDTGWERLYTGDIAEPARALKELADDGRLVLVTPDCKSLFKRHPVFFTFPQTCWFDCSLAAYLLSPEDRGYTWDQVAVRWGEQTADGRSPETNPGLLALDLYALMRERLRSAALTDVFFHMEMPLVPVLTRMEARGIPIDKSAFAGFLREVQKQLERLTETIHTQAGRPFNIRSSQQLGDVLFSVLNLPKAGKTKGGAASTSQEALEKLAGSHPIIETILDYRKLEKLRSTYLEPLPSAADKNNRIHTTFNQTATATGRLSSSNPNLQNIPIRGDFGARMRSCFIAAPGKRLVGADYSQIELRVLAHLSGDPTLLDAFHKNEDIHSRTAGLLFDVPAGEVTPDQRRNAKTINFGLIYGMGAQRLAQDMRITVKEAKGFIERYFERLSRLKEFYDAVETEAREQGYVSTMAGRRRFTPDILSQNNQLRSQARRQAINTRIQGSAADIIKLAMIAVENDAVLRDLGARLLLQIHDELLLEASPENAEAAGERLAELMRSVKPGGQELAVPLLADWGVGGSWAEAH